MVKTSNSEKTTVLKKGAWSPEEDRKLVAYIKKYKIWNWTEMSKAAGLARSGKSCRLRWVNYLRPDIKHGNFTEEEEDTMMTLHGTLGNRWSAIAAKLPGRTDNDVKNYWHTHLKKRLKTYSTGRAVPMAELQEPDDEASPKVKNLSESDLTSNSKPAESMLSKLEGSEISTVVPPQLVLSSTDNFRSLITSSASLITSSAPTNCEIGKDQNVDINYESIDIDKTSSETLIHEERQSLWTQQAPVLVGDRDIFDRPNHDDIQLIGSSTSSQVCQQDHQAMWPYDFFCYDWIDYIDKTFGN